MVIFTIIGVLTVSAFIVMGLVFLGLVTYPPIYRAFHQHAAHARQQLAQGSQQ